MEGPLGCFSGPLFLWRLERPSPPCFNIWRIKVIPNVVMPLDGVGCESYIEAMSRVTISEAFGLPLYNRTLWFLERRGITNFRGLCTLSDRDRSLFGVLRKEAAPASYREVRRRSLSEVTPTTLLSRELLTDLLMLHAPMSLVRQISSLDHADHRRTRRRLLPHGSPAHL